MKFFWKCLRHRVIILFFISCACNFRKKYDFFNKNYIVENNDGPENSQHPPISRRLPLFDVQIFTMLHRAGLRSSRRCVGVLFASCSLCVSFRKFKASVSILCSITSIFTKKQGFIWKSPRLASETHLAADTCSCTKPQIFFRFLSNHFTKKISSIFPIDESILQIRTSRCEENTLV